MNMRGERNVQYLWETLRLFVLKEKQSCVWELVRRGKGYDDLLGSRRGFVLVGFVFLWSVISINAATFTVTKIADTNDGVCNADCSLREAIVAANSEPTNDFINFDPLIFNAAQIITLDGSQLVIGAGTNLTIEGSGAALLSINGNNQSRVLFVGEGAVANISGLKITGGNGTDPADQLPGGGAVRTEPNSIVTFSNLVITANRSTTNQGCGIFVRNATFTMTNSVISNCSNSGGFMAWTSTSSIINSTITGNAGSGIFLSNGTFSLDSSTVSNNSTGGEGGGLLNFGGTVTITNSTLSDNLGQMGGGGISGSNGEITVANSNIINNTGGYTGEAE